MPKDIDKAIKKQLLLLLIASVLFVGGIPGIPLGIAYRMPYIWIPCIVFVVTGFYGLPLGYINWAEKITNRNYISVILSDGILDMRSLANNFGKKEKYVQTRVSTLLQKRYLPGLSFNADKTALVTVVKAKPAAQKHLCLYCGAVLKKDDTACPYCGGETP
jgi:hypothetical protein